MQDSERYGIKHRYVYMGCVDQGVRPPASLPSVVRMLYGSQVQYKNWRCLYLVGYL